MGILAAATLSVRLQVVGFGPSGPQSNVLAKPLEVLVKDESPPAPSGPSGAAP